MDGTILGQGTFTVGTTVTSQIVAIPSGADWMMVRNYTKWGVAGGATAYGIRYFWQRGMPAGSALVEYYANGGAVLTGDSLTVGGFTLFDPSGQTNGAQGLLGVGINTTAATSATRPVVSTGNTAGVAVGDVVRVVNRAAGVNSSVYGIDMVVGAVVDNTSITLLAASNALANAPGAAGTTGTYYKVNYDALYYPRLRYITNITQATQAQVSTSVGHGLTPGQQVRFSIPAVSGMIQLNPTPQNTYLAATVVSVVDLYNFTINIDTTGFTAFTFPTVAQQPSGFPTLTPIGENTGAAIASATAQVPLDWRGNPIYNANSGILADSTVNTGYLGMILGTGGTGVISAAALTGPAGSATNDVMYWMAGKSSYGGL